MLGLFPAILPLFVPLTWWSILLFGGLDLFILIQKKNKPKFFALFMLAFHFLPYGMSYPSFHHVITSYLPAPYLWITSYGFLRYLCPLVWVLFFVNFRVLLSNGIKTLWIHCPSIVTEGERFSFTVEAWDRYERLAGGYKGEISFDIKSYSMDLKEIEKTDAELPETYQFTSSIPRQGIIPAYFFKGADNGKKTFEMRISTPGIHYLIVREEGNQYRSNPILVQSETSERQSIYWGDIHGHTLYSDGAGTLKHAFEFARNVALVDFTAVTDHLTSFLKLGPVLRHYFRVAERHNDTGSFLTFPALEWSPGFLLSGKVSGHFNLYFKDATSLTRPLKWKESSEIYEYMRKGKKELLAWPHHTVKREFLTDWGFHREDLSPLVEVWSVHGSSETVKGDPEDPRFKGYSIRAALTMGYRVGLMASSDTHDGRPGHPISHTKANHVLGYPYSLSGNKMEHGHPGGIVGVYANELTRDAVFNALKTRKCYASSWVARPLMYFKVNGVAVGEQDSIVKVPSKTAKRELSLLICADGVSMESNNPTEIKKVEIFKNAKLWNSFPVNRPVFKETVTDDTPIHGTNYATIKKRGYAFVSKRSRKPIERELGSKYAFYYVRMTDSKGRMAWIGPIWVGVKEASSASAKE